MPISKDFSESGSGLRQNPALSSPTRSSVISRSSSPARRSFNPDERSSFSPRSSEWSPERQRREPRLSSSLSIERSGLLGTRSARNACDVCSCFPRCGAYRYSSPVFSRFSGVPENVEMMDNANINAVLSRLSILPMEMKGYLLGTSLKEKLQTIRKTLREDGYSAQCESKPWRETCHRKEGYDRETKPWRETCHRKACYDHRAEEQSATSSNEPKPWRETCHRKDSYDRETKPWRETCHRKDIYDCETKPWRETCHRKACYDHRAGAEEQSATLSHEFLSPFASVSRPSLHDTTQFWPSLPILHIQEQDSFRESIGTGSSSCPIQEKQNHERQMDDLYLQRIADDCRKEFAFRIIDKFVHSKLTHYMLLYITACAKALTGDEKTKFLSLFKTEGAFKDKPLNEATYCELLSFVDSEFNPAKETVTALYVSEKSLLEEGFKEGYDFDEIGDIRAQMRAFTSLRKPTSPFVNSRVDDYETFFTTELLEDLLRMADKQKLGDLQILHNIIKLACFFALKGMDCSSSSY